MKVERRVRVHAAGVVMLSLLTLYGCDGKQTSRSNATVPSVIRQLNVRRLREDTIRVSAGRSDTLRLSRLIADSLGVRMASTIAIVDSSLIAADVLTSPHLVRMRLGQLGSIARSGPHGSDDGALMGPRVIERRLNNRPRAGGARYDAVRARRTALELMPRPRSLFATPTGH